MTAIPNPRTPLFDGAGEATQQMRAFLMAKGNPPRGLLVDGRGMATPVFRDFLTGIVGTPLPSLSEPLADSQGRATRVMTALLMGLP
jgi:hypothetical protein